MARALLTLALAIAGSTLIKLAGDHWRSASGSVANIASHEQTGNRCFVGALVCCAAILAVWTVPSSKRTKRFQFALRSLLLAAVPVSLLAWLWRSPLPGYAVAVFALVLVLAPLAAALAERPGRNS